MKDLGTLSDDVLSVTPCCDIVDDRRQVVGFSSGLGAPIYYLALTAERWQ